MNEIAAPSQEVGTHLLFENDVVRVWDLALGPGQVTQLHRHGRDFVFVYVTEDNELEVRVPGELPDGVRAPDGYVSYTSVGSGNDARLTHELANVGSRPHRQVLVELLDRPAGRQEGPARTKATAGGSDAWSDRSQS